jgi:hypothetical protein
MHNLGYYGLIRRKTFSNLETMNKLTKDLS